MKSFKAVLFRCMPYVLFAFAAIAGFLLFWYSDIGDTLDNSVLLVESVLEGDVRSFYEHSSKNAAPGTVYSANYNIVLYIVFAIWNLPTALMHIFSGLDYTVSIPALLWAKAMIVFVYLLIALELRKIVKILSPEDKSAPGRCVFLMLTSLCTFVPALVAAQYDCISIFFMLVGLRLYMEKKDVLSILVFSLSVPFKMFSLFLLIPIVLLRYKNVFKILLCLAPVMLPSFLLSLPFSNDLYYEAALGSQNGDAIRLILSAVISVDNMQLNINLFLIVYFVICLFAYSRKEKSLLDEARMAVYLGLMAFSAFCSLVHIRSYWIVLYVPFLAILASIHKGNRTMALLTDTLAGVGGGLYVLANHWIYNTGEIFSKLLLKNARLPEGRAAKYTQSISYALPEGVEPEFGHFAGFLDSFGVMHLRFIFMALFIASILFALIKFYPHAKDASASGPKGEKWLYLARPAILICTCLLLLFVHFASVPESAYATDASGVTLTKIDLVTQKAESASFFFEKDASLLSFTMPVHTDKVNRTSRSFITFRLYENGVSDPVWEDAIGIAALIDKKAVTLDMDNIPVFSDRPYVLSVEGSLSERFSDGSVYAYLNEDGEIAFSLR